jgi:hypothetical protein
VNVRAVFFPWSTLSADEHRAAKLWFDIRGRDDAFRTFIDTMILSEIANIGPCSESDAHENVAQQVFARIYYRSGGGARGRDEAERIFKKMAIMPKRKIIASRTRSLRKIYDLYVLQRGAKLLTLAKAIHKKDPGRYGPTIGAIHGHFRRFRKPSKAPARIKAARRSPMPRHARTRKQNGPE